MCPKWPWSVAGRQLNSMEELCSIPRQEIYEPVTAGGLKTEFFQTNSKITFFYSKSNTNPDYQGGGAGGVARVRIQLYHLLAV